MRFYNLINIARYCLLNVSLVIDEVIFSTCRTSREKVIRDLLETTEYVESKNEFMNEEVRHA